MASPFWRSIIATIRIPFTKLHGAKNDFLLTPVEQAPTEDLPQVAVDICDRYTGIGGDGWILVDRTAGHGYDASIRLFNSDGSEAELSGNGTRCAAALLAGDAPEPAGERAEVRIRTGAGVKALRLISRHENKFLFEMNMGGVRVIELRAMVQGHDAVLVDPGNPQCALPVDNFDFDWRRLGASIERDPRFPNRTNVSFIRRAGDHSIEVRFWERGAGETNSSGTGSTGAAIAAVARGLVTSPVEIITPAGPLHLRLEEYSPGQNCGTAYLTGPAARVGEGVFYRARIGR